MIEVQLNEKEFDICMNYCISHRENGSFKYLYEISVPDNEFGKFLEWLNKCEKAELTFLFLILDRYKGHKLLYGFSNFEVQETPNMKCFDFSLQNNDVLYDRFKLWSEESVSCIMPISLNLYFKILNAPIENTHLKVVSKNETEEDK